MQRERTREKIILLLILILCIFLYTFFLMTSQDYDDDDNNCDGDATEEATGFALFTFFLKKEGNCMHRSAVVIIQILLSLQKFRGWQLNEIAEERNDVKFEWRGYKDVVIRRFIWICKKKSWVKLKY